MFDTATGRDTNLDIRAKHQQTLARRGHILRHFAIRVSLIQPSAPHELIAEDAISANGDLKNDFLYVLQYADETVLPAHRQLLKHIYGIDDLDGVFEDRLQSIGPLEPFSRTSEAPYPRGQSFSELTQEVARTTHDRQIAITDPPTKLLDSADMLAILNARGTIMLNQSFMPIHRLPILKLASLALCLWADLPSTAMASHYEVNALHKAVIERALLMVRDDIYTHLVEASNSVSCYMDQGSHIEVLKTTVGTWQKIVQRRISNDRAQLDEHVQSLRNLCDEAMQVNGVIHGECCLWATTLTTSSQWVVDHKSEWTGPLLLDENDGSLSRKLVIPGVERNEMGCWFRV